MPKSSNFFWVVVDNSHPNGYEVVPPLPFKHLLPTPLPVPSCLSCAWILPNSVRCLKLGMMYLQFLEHAWQSTGTQEIFVELNSDCSPPSHFDLPTAISFPEVPFRCFGRWGKWWRRKGFSSPEESVWNNEPLLDIIWPFHFITELHNLTVPSLVFI